MKYLVIWRIFSIIGLLGMIFLILAWNGWLSQIQKIPRSLEMLVLLVPLLLFVRGILYGRYSTHVKAAITAILYFLLGAWYSFTPQEEGYGYLLVLFSFMLYLGGFLYARTIMKRDKSIEEAMNSSQDKDLQALPQVKN